jgi:hypothetical protein
MIEEKKKDMGKICDGFKGNKKLYAVMWDKMKPKTELYRTLDKNEKLAWGKKKKTYFTTLMEYLKDLLHARNGGEGSTENNTVPENGNTLDQVHMNMLDLGTVIT